MDEMPPAGGGLFSSVTRIFQTLRDIVVNRVELFLTELKEERLRLFDALLLAAIAIVCAGMTLVMLTLTVVVIFWDTHRLLVLALVTVAYAASAVVALMKLRSRLQHWRAFSATLEQLKKDRLCLQKPN